MGSTTLERSIAERQRALRRSLGNELRDVRRASDLSMRTASAAAGLHFSHLPRIEAGDRLPSLDALVALAAAMGHDVSIRLFPSTGPRVRDRIQVRMIEALLAILHPRWVPRLEVAVYRPARGVIDIVLQDRLTTDIVSGEAHSVIHAVERQLRWAGEKTDALSSARGWPWVDTVEPPRVGRLLLVRSCAAMHDLVRSVPLTFASAYPAEPGAALEALTGPDARWPGAAILWVRVEGAATRILEHAPSGLSR